MRRYEMMVNDENTNVGRNVFDPAMCVVRDEDRELFDTYLRSFVPPGSFDAHAHVYAAKHLGMADLDTSVVVDMDAFRRMCSQWMGDLVPTGGLFLPVPTNPQMDVDGANRFVANEVAKCPGSVAEMLVRPGDDPADVEAKVAERQVGGFKVYHTFADRENTFHADTAEFLPECAWQIAHEREMVITLHMVRPTAIADPDNQKYINEHCRAYPNAKLILAHAARGFCSHHVVRGLPEIAGLDNVYFDTSAICEPGAFEAILRVFGGNRLMYGSDFQICNLRGKCMSVGDSFVWIYDHVVDWKTDSPYGTPTLVGIESLLALQQACINQGVRDADIERIFSRNARELLNV